MRKNKIRNSEGITLVALVVTIVVTLIIASITIYNGAAIIKEARVEDIKTNMLLIQAKAKIKLEDNVFKGTTTDYIGTKVTDSSMLEKISLEAGQEENCYYLTEEDLKNMNLESLKVPEGEYYIVYYDAENVEVDVFYTAGVMDAEGNLYYKLSEMVN